MMNRIGKGTWWAISVAAAVLAAPFVASLLGLWPWSPIHCWHYEVDLCSGRIRYTRYFAFAPVQERIEDSAISKVLRPEDRLGALPEWRRVHTFSPGVRHSPHYTFHSAMYQMRELELTWRSGKFTPAAQRASARRLLQLWLNGGSDDAARPYLFALSI